MTHDRPMPSVATVTVSDSRGPLNDESGQLVRQLGAAAGWTLLEHAIVRDEVAAIETEVRRLVAAGADAVVLTGGTGIGPRDVTVEALEPLLDKKMEGFGEAFRRLSWEQVGARSMLSRATAGVMAGKLVFALPGSPKAVRLGVQQFIIPVLEHAVQMLAGVGHSHHHHHG